MGALIHRLTALGNKQRHETAERMRHDRIDLAEVIAHREHRARTVGEICAPARAQPVSGKVERDDAQSGAAQRLHERRHEGGLARPAMHQHDGAARLAIGLEDIGLHIAGGRRDALPLGVAEMETRARGELVVIVGAMLRQLGRAKCGRLHRRPGADGSVFSTVAARGCGQRSARERFSCRSRVTASALD